MKVTVFTKCKKRFAFVSAAMIAQYIIVFFKSISFELQKSFCYLVQAQAEANHTNIVNNKALTLYIRGLHTTPRGPNATREASSSGPRSHFANDEKNNICTINLLIL